MSPIKFPRHPDDDRQNPFQDQEGRNPFADPAAPAAEEEDRSSPYAAGGRAVRRPYHPDQYEAILPHRGPMVLRLGILGATIAVLGLIAMAAGMVTGQEMGIQIGSPFGLLGLAFAIPAFGLGFADLRAIRAGAMDPAGRRPTRTGMALGVVGTVTAAIPVGLTIASALW